MTAGIVSAVNRDIMESPFDDYIQTSAAPDENGSGQRTTQQVTWMLQQTFDTPDLQGALVSEVKDKDDVMLQGKIKLGDVVMSYNGQKVSDSRDLARKVAQAAAGSDAALEIFRAGLRQTIHVTVQVWPEDKPEAAHAAMPRTLGLELAAATQDSGEPTVKVISIDPTGTAADSGIEKGDIIVEIQRTPVSTPDQAQRLFEAQSATKHSFAAVLVERGKKHTWIPIAVPD